jgi:hypothetical protein
MEITLFYLGPNLQEGYVIRKYAKAIFIDALRLKTRQSSGFAMVRYLVYIYYFIIITINAGHIHISAYVIRTNKMYTFYINGFLKNYSVFDMFRTSKFSSSGRHVLAVLWCFYN